MADIAYFPKGHVGYTCELVSAGWKTLSITREDLEHEPEVEGSSALKDNLSVVGRLGAYADNELAWRRARREDRKASLRKSADLHRKIVLDLADLVDLVGDETTTAWCSGCLEKREHHWVERRSLTPDAYICAGCGASTTPCLWPRCEHFALRKPGVVQLGKYCLEHLHDIPSFDKLDAPLDSLDDYDGWLEFDSRHAKQITALTGGLMGGMLIVAPLFFAAAPAIGGAIGAWGTGLSGAAASSHGLALLGGGAVASGGMGMVGGTAVVTAAGAGLGSAMGASVTTSYAGDDPSFSIELIEPGDGAPVVFSSGFLTEDKDGWGEWESTIRSRYPSSAVYRLHWGAKEQRDLRRLLTRGGGAIGGWGGLVRKASTATRMAARKVGLIGGALTIAEVAKNPWSVARTRANMTGAVLADLIARTDTTGYVLVGHSLGARVMLAATEALGSRDSDPQLDSVHLLGAAVSADHDLVNVGAAVSDTVWNYWSGNDKTLGAVYRGAQLGQRAAGAVGFTTTHPKVKNRNVSRQVPGHTEYVPKVVLC